MINLEVSRQLFSAIFCVAAIVFLPACHLGSLHPSFDDRVQFRIVMHEDGSCTGTIFGRKIEAKHKATFSRRNQNDQVHWIECRTPTPGWTPGATTIIFSISSYYDNTPLPIDLSLDTASRESQTIIPEEKKAIITTFRAAGVGSLDGVICPILILDEKWTFEINTGEDRKQHILSGSGRRLCTF